jgi:hypothetical protein
MNSDSSFQWRKDVPLIVCRRLSLRQQNLRHVTRSDPFVAMK